MTELEQLIAQTDKAFDNLREACPYREADLLDDLCDNPVYDLESLPWRCHINNCPLLGEGK